MHVPHHPRQFPVVLRVARRRAITFVELMLALTITVILSAGVLSLLVGALNTDEFLRTSNVSGSELDLAVRRLSNNLLESQTGTITMGGCSVTSGAQTLTSATLSLVTQPDAVNNRPNGVTVSYRLQADTANPGQFVLSETDQRYGTSTLVHYVTTFNVTSVAGAPNLYQVDLVVGGRRVQERHFKIFNRN